MDTREGLAATAGNAPAEPIAASQFARPHARWPWLVAFVLAALAYLLTSNYDLRLTQERHPKIQFHPLREHAGLKLEQAA